MRTFIAIKINPQGLLPEIFQSLKKELANESIRWVDEHDLHLTVKFIGETTEEQVLQIINNIARYTSKAQPFSLTFEGLGMFMSNKMPRVLFINISTKENLKKLAADIDNELLTYGIEKEMRPFNPHLTLARIKYLRDRNSFYQLVQKYNYKISESVAVNEIIFYQSILKPAGPFYKELAVFPLQSS